MEKTVSLLGEKGPVYRIKIHFNKKLTYIWYELYVIYVIVPFTHVITSTPLVIINNTKLINRKKKLDISWVLILHNI